MTKTTKTAVDQNTIRRRGTGLRAYNPEKAFRGYTLFAPLVGQSTVYLIDMEGEVVHQWKLPYPPAQYGYLLPNGNLLYNGQIPESPSRFPLWSIFKGGVVLEAEPSGKIVWEYYHPDHHHEARRLRNGNTMVLCIEKIPRWLVSQVKGGVPGTEIDGDMYADVLYEVNPAGEIIWTWHAWEYLDTETDIILLQEYREEWTHANTVDELSDGNIILCFRNISTVVIIDRQTEKIVWKLGYDVLAQPHVPNELPNGNLLIFDNGQHRQNEAVNYSRVIEIDRQTKEIVWEYKDDPAQSFYSPYLSGAQRLPNGNTLIVEGSFGRIFEVTAAGEVVWEYVNPYFGRRTLTAETTLMRGEYNSVFRAFRYAPEEIPWL